jgi:REP element-mobilizing transposase RayT
MDEWLQAPMMFTHGGKRAGAGRKRAAHTRRGVAHRIRPVHAQRYPSHVTVPFLSSVGSLRRERIFKALRSILHRPRIDGFKVVHYSVQKDHVHLIVEATDCPTFSRGMRSLDIRMALKINDLLGRPARKGKVLRDRYHRRDLYTGRQVRAVLVYVLLNAVKHGHVSVGKLDPFSSSRFFTGWRDVEPSSTAWIPHPTGDPHPEPELPTTRLLLRDWRIGGLLSPHEAFRWTRSR